MKWQVFVVSLVSLLVAGCAAPVYVIQATNQAEVVWLDVPPDIRLFKGILPPNNTHPAVVVLYMHTDKDIRLVNEFLRASAPQTIDQVLPGSPAYPQKQRMLARVRYEIIAVEPDHKFVFLVNRLVDSQYQRYWVLDTNDQLIARGDVWK